MCPLPCKCQGLESGATPDSSSPLQRATQQSKEVYQQLLARTHQAVAALPKAIARLRSARQLSAQEQQMLEQLAANRAFVHQLARAHQPETDLQINRELREPADLVRRLRSGRGSHGD